MTRRSKFLSASTALTLALSGAAMPVSAQPFENLSGLMIPQCEGDGEPVDAGTLEAEAFGTEQPVAPFLVEAAHQQGEVCLDPDGRLELSGQFAQATGGGATALPSDSPSASAPADASGLAKILQGDADPAEPAPGGEPAEVTTETEIDPNAPAAPEQESAGRADEEQPVKAEPQPKTVEAPAAAPEPEPEQPVAAAAEDNGRDSEPAQVSETTVTEENSRSSSEEFATATGSGTANAQSSGGLSNLEKFAIGAAGLVALNAIIGQDSEVVSNTGDRVVVRRSDGDLEVLRDDDTLLRRPGSDVRTETFSDGSTRTTVTRANGSKIVTIADASGRVIKRTRITADGREIVLIDDTQADVQPVDVTRLPPPAPERNFVEANDRAALEAALRAETRADLDRRFSLRQVREYSQVRSLMPEINIDAINFATGSAAIQPQEAEELFELGQVMSSFVQENPDELFLVEGHTDAVGDAVYNLALSDRRAESVALALTEYFGVPPENMIIQGYGESELLVPTADAERANRRAVVRRVTPLLR